MLPRCAGFLAVLTALLSGCSRAPTEGAAPSSNGVGARPISGTTPAPFCGGSPSDWCSAPPGDPCGEHKDTASCKLDARCKGMLYRGEFVVACSYDERGFGTNCPTVGCVSR
jgi:hypothetical protein